MPEYKEITLQAAKGALKGAATGTAASFVSGIALVSVPVKLFGLITVGSATVVAAPAVAGLAAGGALVGGAYAAFAAYRRQRGIEKEFDRHVNSGGHNVSEPGA